MSNATLHAKYLCAFLVGEVCPRFSRDVAELVASYYADTLWSVVIFQRTQNIYVGGGCGSTVLDEMTSEGPFVFSSKRNAKAFLFCRLRDHCKWQLQQEWQFPSAVRERQTQLAEARSLEALVGFFK